MSSGNRNRSDEVGHKVALMALLVNAIREHEPASGARIGLISSVRPLMLVEDVGPEVILANLRPTVRA